MTCLFLMLNQKITAKEIEKIINSKFKNFRTDTWAELDILEIEIKNDQIIDFVEAENDETIDCDDKKLFESKGFKSVYCISYEDSNKDIVTKIIKEILSLYDGVVGSDTDDFEPILDKDYFLNSK